MTQDERIFRQRKACLAYAEEIGNISEACRAFDISRTTFYEWQKRANRYGLDALWPRQRRRPVQPNTMAPWEVQTILAEAIARPTLGARRLLVHLEQRGVERSASGVQKVLVRHNLGRREQRLGLLAQATAVAGGPVTEAAIDDLGGQGAFCHCAPFPGDLVALDSFYVGKLKGVGTVWQFTAIDTATRWAIAELVVDNHTAKAAAAFLDLVVERFADLDVQVTGILTDLGPEFTGRDFTGHVDQLDIDHHRTPPASPDHNAVCERVQQTILEECYRPAFHRQYFTSVTPLQRQVDGYLHRYNTVRRNHGDYMAGRTPRQVLDFKLDQLEQAS